MEYFALIGEFIGGIGIFVLAMRLMTDGLKAAVAERLRTILAKWTSTTSRGVLTGAGMTAVVQSSSAVTVAVIGFVNAGLLNIQQAIGVVFGSNIGTTMTGWLVSIVGFNLKVEAFALPAIGIGTALWLLRPQGRAGGIGQALLGFGLFFLGLDVLKGAFEGIAPSVNLEVVADYGSLGVALMVGIGFLMTLLTQSSSAAIAITLTAAAGGVVALPSAAAIVIGANIGTTSTALFASIGATSNAKRVALAHVVFNVVTGIIALAGLPVLLWFVGIAEGFLATGGNVTVTLALFHTVFNVVGVLVLAPFARRLSDWLEGRFRTEEEDIGRPKFLDSTVLETSVLALNALYLELLRVAGLARDSACVALRPTEGSMRLIERNTALIDRLRAAIDAFATDLGRTRLSEDVVQSLMPIYRIGQTIAEIPRLSSSVRRMHAAVEEIAVNDLKVEFDELITQCEALVKASDPVIPEFSTETTNELLISIEDHYDRLRQELLIAATRAQIPTPLLDDLLDHLIIMRRLARRIDDLADRLDSLGQAIEFNGKAPQTLDERN